jgi:hypothetical protein
MNELDLICSTSETIVDNDNDYYVPDKYDQTKLIHLDEVILFGTLFGRKKVFNSINFKTGFAADSDFYEQATNLFRVKKLSSKLKHTKSNDLNSFLFTKLWKLKNDKDS